jgi:hypothetical protein
MYGALVLIPDFSAPHDKERVSKSIDNLRDLPQSFRRTASMIRVNFFDDEPMDTTSIRPARRSRRRRWRIS